MSLRKEFIEFASQSGANIAQLCRQYDISRKTGYKLLKRYKEKGLEGLANQSRRPHVSPKKSSEGIVEEVLRIRKAHPTWGARKIQAILRREEKVEVPVASCIHKILQQAELVNTEKSNKPQTSCRFEHEAPNHLWQMDFKGHFAYEQGRCHPLTILDDHSRFSVALRPCVNEQRQTVQDALVEVFERYGLPQRINVDNGAPWGSLFECARYTSLSVWLIKLGIMVSYSRPHHPQTNGKDERFHRTLKEEVLNHQYFKDLQHIEQVFAQWRQVYNFERPHQALNMAVPADRYRPSYREYRATIDDYSYAQDYMLRNVDVRGRIHIEGRQLFVGIPFAKETIGIRYQSGNDDIDIYFRHQRLGEIALNQIAKGTLVNLYSKRVLSA